MKKVLLVFLSLFVSPAFASGINANSASAPCTNNTLETYSGNTNLQADWQPNEIQLRWYNENERLTVQSSAQSCVYDGTLTIPSTQPTRTGYTFAGWEVKHTIPSDYTELEYVTNTANTYLNTGIIPDVDDIEMEIKVKPSLGSWYIFQNRNNVYASGFGISGGSDNNTIRWFVCDKSYGQSTLFRYKTDIYIVRGTTQGNNATLYVKNLTQNIEDTQTTTYTCTTQQTFPLWIFGNLKGDRATAGNDVYYAKVKKMGIDVMNYIPVRRNSDSTVGFYDTVSKTFKTVSEGALIAGPVVQ